MGADLNEQQRVVFDYMPWAGLDMEHVVGPVSIGPFQHEDEARIPSSALRDQLAAFFKKFVDHSGQPVKTVALCTWGPLELRNPAEEEFNQMQAAADCLAFAMIANGTKQAVAAGNRSMAPPSAERFDLCARWVWPSKEGSLVVRTHNGTSVWAGTEYRIPEPISIGGSTFGNYEPTLEGLSKSFAPAFPAELRARLHRALGWFRLAHTESTAVPWHQKIVMMATAFEILLDCPDRGKKAFLRDEIEKQFRLDRSIVTRLKITRDKKIVEEDFCRAAAWAAEFYELRSSIVHGDELSAARRAYSGWHTHLIVADLVFLELVQRLLFKQDCFGERVRAMAEEYAKLGTDPVETYIRVLLPGIAGLNVESVHEALGWVPPRLKSDPLAGVVRS